MGAALILHGGIPFVQNMRESLDASRARDAYQSTVAWQSPVEFGGHSISISDRFPQSRTGQREMREDTVAVMVDGVAALPARKLFVTLGGDQLGRYYSWIQVTTLRDRASGQRLLTIARRRDDIASQNPQFDLLQISESGSMAITAPHADDRRGNPLILAALSPLADDVPLYPWSRYLFPFTISFLPFALILELLPFVSIAGGAWLLVRAWRGRAFGGK